jgi:hypothetical protein
LPAAAVGATAAEEDDDAGPAAPSASGKLTRTMQSVNLPASNCSRRRSACVGDGGGTAELYELLDLGATAIRRTISTQPPWLTAVAADYMFKRTMDGMALLPVVTYPIRHDWKAW